jgi:acetyl esterase/lipase
VASEELRKCLEFFEARQRRRAGHIDDLAARRREIDAAGHDPLPDGVEVEDARLGAIAAIRLRPEHRHLERGILYFHGGGFHRGSTVSHRGVAARLAKASATEVVLIDYRLAPEHPFPAALEDTVSAFRAWTDEVAPERIALVGDSAGGGLVVATLVALRDQGHSLPGCGVCLSPWVDLREDDLETRRMYGRDPVLVADDFRLAASWYLGGTPPETPLASPVLADLHGLPPLLVQVGSEEILLEDAVRLVERARAARVPAQLRVFEGLFHVFQVMRNLPEAAAALGEVAAFLDDAMRT